LAVSDPSDVKRHGKTHVGTEEAKRIAALARLRFDESELARITEDLNHILDHVEDLRSLESRAAPEGVVADRRSTRGEDADRPDELRRECASFAPDWRGGFFVVPPFPGVHQEDGA
jgi:aspartyl/glutamyl-tRNA(Asn/Gln) amidotransferase C subunit